MCSYLRFSPIIVTLGMLGAIRGITLLITVDPLYGLDGVFNTLGSGEVGGFPVIVMIALGVFLVGGIFLSLTPWGRYVYAIGVNPQAAFLSGLPIRSLPFMLYVATGASAGLAGVMFAARLGGTSPADLGIGMELTALTAILLGGVAFAGRPRLAVRCPRRRRFPRGDAERTGAAQRAAVCAAARRGFRAYRRGGAGRSRAVPRRRGAIADGRSTSGREQRTR